MKSLLKITAFGNPLLDTTVIIPDKSLLERHNLKIDDVVEIPAKTMANLTKDIENMEKTTTAGGCAHNTLKILKWLLSEQCTTQIFGGIGRDEAGRTLEKLIQSAGIETHYYRNKVLPTGQSIGLISGPNRSLAAHLGAAEMIRLDDLKDCNIVEELHGTHLVYIEGFFLTNREKIVDFIADFCVENRKKLAFNISGEYVCEKEPKSVIKLANECGILFGNYREYQALAHLYGFGDNVESLLASLGRNRLDKIIVVTRGPGHVTVQHNQEKQEFPVDEIEEIVDTTGAGDAFVGGFLAGVLLGRVIKQCFHAGQYAAKEIIKRIGCSIPEHPPLINI